MVSIFLKIIAHGCVAAWTLSRYYLLQSIVGRSSSARALRLGFQSLGVNWVKLGQDLSLKFDILPGDVCRELLRIENNIKPFAFAEVERVIAHEFGRSPEQLFNSFDVIPFAVTSSGQLHKAVNSDGTQLVVKVQRELTGEEFRVQSAVMPLLAVILDNVAAFGTRNFSILVDDFLQQRAAELSFAVTTTNAKKISSLAEGDPSEQNINICSEYSGRQVLTWEFIDGVPVADIIDAARAVPSARACLPAHDLDRIARQIYRNALNQIFRDGIFHADISAAGLLVLPTNTIAYVDFAVVGRLYDERQRSLQAYYESLLQGQVDDAADRLLDIAEVARFSDDTELRRSLAAILQDRLDGFESPLDSPPRSISQNTYQRLMSAFRDHGITLPGDLSIYFRTMLTIEALTFELCPQFDALAEQSRFFSLAAREDYRQSLELPFAVEQMARLYRDAVDLVSDLRKLHNSARDIDITLRTLRIRLLQYGFWGVLAAACTYFGLREQETTVLKAFLLPGALLIALFLLGRVWRQSRQLSRVDRAIVSTGEVSSRSLGRVR